MVWQSGIFFFFKQRIKYNTCTVHNNMISIYYFRISWILLDIPQEFVDAVNGSVMFHNSQLL